MALHIHPLTPERWPALEELFGRAGASNGCWCMYWRIGPGYSRRPRTENREAFEAIVAHGPAPGLIAFDGETPVGWCQATPRSALPWLVRSALTRSQGEPSAWTISCFFVRSRWRRKGVAAALIGAAIEAARYAGATAVEAWPVDTRAPGATRNLFMGVASAFEQAGFVTIARRAPHRPLMRLEL